MQRLTHKPNNEYYIHTHGAGQGTRRRMSSVAPTRAAAKEGGRAGFGGEAVAPSLEEMNTPRMAALEGGAGEPSSPTQLPPAKPSSPQPAGAGHHAHTVDTLAWRDLSYYYKTKGKGKEGSVERAAVKQCTGLVRRGDMVAVMGT